MISGSENEQDKRKLCFFILRMVYFFQEVKRGVRCSLKFSFMH